MMNFITAYIQRFLLGYGYCSIPEFMKSLCPSFKYNLQVPIMSISTVIALISHFLGIGFLVVFAMFVAVIVETVTGIYASHKQKIEFESFKFSRCVLKVFIWMCLIFICNCFYLECADGHTWIDTIGAWFFAVVKLLILAYFVFEYVVSILENFAVIDGKPKTEFIQAIKGLWQSLVHRTSSKGEE